MILQTLYEKLTGLKSYTLNDHYHLKANTHLEIHLNKETKILYEQHGWLGCQLCSIEFNKPSLLETRVLTSHLDPSIKYTFELYDCRKVHSFKYKCYWALKQKSNYAEYGALVFKALQHLFNSKNEIA